MAKINRARQFMPFAALKGYEEMVKKKIIVPEARRTMDEDHYNILADKLNALNRGDMVEVEYYCGNGYTRINGLVNTVNSAYRELVIVRTIIKFDDIWEIHGQNVDVFDDIGWYK